MNKKCYLLEVIFYRNLSVTKYTRVIYGPLDYLGDVGGLSDALTGIGSLLIFLIRLSTGSKLEKHLQGEILERDNSHK